MSFQILLVYIYMELDTEPRPLAAHRHLQRCIQASSDFFLRAARCTFFFLCVISNVISDTVGLHMELDTDTRPLACGARSLPRSHTRSADIQHRYPVNEFIYRLDSGPRPLAAHCRLRRRALRAEFCLFLYLLFFFTRSALREQFFLNFFFNFF